jgi:methyl-accepting chemotaxis protein
LQGFIVAAEIQVKRAESPYQDIAGLATDAIQVASTASAQNQDLRELSQRLDRLNAALVEINRAMDGLWLHAERCVDGTGQAERAARGAEENIRSVREHSEKFIQVLEVVRKIARRTNLLALNATIEAARAGDSGKGFQVVALEVAKLSEDTAQNLRFLDDLIAQTDEATLQGSHEVSQVFAMSQEIHALVEAMKAQVGDVRRVLQAQSQANDAILKNVLRMGQSVEEIDRSAARQKASAEALKVTVGKIGTETQWLATESVGLDSLLEEVHTMTAALATVAEDHQGQRLAAV